MSRQLIALAGLFALAAGGCAGATPRTKTITPTLVRSAQTTGRGGCPRAVLYDASSVAPVKQVLLAAQRLLARQRYGSQGKIYRLTPRNAPIDEVFRAAVLRGPLDETQPGLVMIHRAAARQCGEPTAQASWAIHYWIPVSVIVNAGAWTFIVKTKAGWRFWGDWCGAGKPRKWRNTYCY